MTEVEARWHKKYREDHPEYVVRQNEARRIRRATNREEHCKKGRDYYQKNKEHIRSLVRDKYTPEVGQKDREKRAAYFEKYYKDYEVRRKSDPIKLVQRRISHNSYYARNRRTRIKKVLQYITNNKDKKRVWARITNHNRRSVVGKHTRNQMLARIEFYGWRCAYCLCKVMINTVHMDHVKPLVKGGANWASNLVPACKLCNLRKSTKLWLPYRLTTQN